MGRAEVKNAAGESASAEPILGMDDSLEKDTYEDNKRDISVKEGMSSLPELIPSDAGAGEGDDEDEYFI